MKEKIKVKKNLYYGSPVFGYPYIGGVKMKGSCVVKLRSELTPVEHKFSLYVTYNYEPKDGHLEDTDIEFHLDSLQYRRQVKDVFLQDFTVNRIFDVISKQSMYSNTDDIFHGMQVLSYNLDDVSMQFNIVYDCIVPIADNIRYVTSAFCCTVATPESRGTSTSHNGFIRYTAYISPSLNHRQFTEVTGSGRCPTPFDIDVKKETGILRYIPDSRLFLVPYTSFSSDFSSFQMVLTMAEKVMDTYIKEKGLDKYLKL